ncbi:MULTISPECIES: hypothetical protein [Photorhabdus]|uniref:Uncharacterized protein n=2 Tax=Photorhabdus TaxID=29487 RepID=A0AAW6BK55_9GAMM|nr:MULTISPECIES: hypothetical protein [Photorhabdus]EYU16588.1 hypothetical protein BA1DRAFT_00872 [Photorhabdus aegyptia]MDB6373888.1 hypothetical protein [Photorhabdus bodei]
MDEEITLTAMYLAVAAKENWENFINTIRTKQIQGEIGLMSMLINHAKSVDAVANMLNKKGYDFPGCWLYEIVEKFGGILVTKDILFLKEKAANILANILVKWFSITRTEYDYFTEEVKKSYLTAYE